MKRAWIENGAVRDIAPGNPDELFHPDIAALFDTEIPDDIERGATLVDGVWVNPQPVEPGPTPDPAAQLPMLSPVQFKMCFTSLERIAIKTAKGSDPVLADAYELLDDPRLTGVDLNLASVQGLVDYIASLDILTPERAALVKAGTIL